jgi:putative ABC transport system ATP-binding protein
VTASASSSAGSLVEAGLSVQCRGLHHVYTVEDTDVVALDRVDLVVRPGETVALLGPSGCGKSTLLSIVAGLQRPTSGRVLVGRDDVTAMTVPELLSLRSNRIGIVVQNPGRSLLPYATAAENIAFAQRGANPSRRAELPVASDLLDDLGLAALAHQRVHAMSGGEQQRVAVAVALSSAPGLLLADEPTSQLDDANRDALVDLLAAANARFGTTVLTVTHDEQVAEAHRRYVRLRDGRIEHDDSAAEDIVTVGDDGTVSVPEHMWGSLPPGSTARVIATVDGVRLVRDDDESGHR